MKTVKLTCQNCGANLDVKDNIAFCSYCGAKLVIDDEEASIIFRVFKEYANGRSSIQICETLNAEGVLSPYKKRLTEIREVRRKQGLKDKEYKKFDIDEMTWRPSTLNRLFHNEIYIGRKHVIFHKPDPTNPEPIEKRKDREVVFEYDEYDEHDAGNAEYVRWRF